MRKVFVLLSIICFVLVFSLETQAQLRKPGFGLGVRAGAQQIKDADLDGADAEFDTAATVGVTGTFNLNQYLSLEAAFDYGLERDVDLASGGVSVKFGEFDQKAATLGLRVHIPTGSAFDPYVGGGVGYYWNSFDLDPTITSVFPGSTAEIDDEFGWFLNAGFEIFVSKNAALCFDARYTWLEPDMTLSVPLFGTATDSVDVDGFTGTLGIKFYF